MKNLFDFATKELSQDAFICWLVSNYDNNENIELKKLAYEFINFISKKEYDYKSNDIKHLNTLQQANNMDVIIDIWETDRDFSNKYSSDFVIVIEDKTTSSAHKDQLKDYGKIIDSWKKWNCSNETKDSVRVFYKINKLSDNDNKELSKDKEWKAYSIDEIFDFFKDKKTDDEIVGFYIEHINKIYKDIHELNKNASEWNYYNFYYFVNNVIREKYYQEFGRDEYEWGYQGKYASTGFYLTSKTESGYPGWYNKVCLEIFFRPENDVFNATIHPEFRYHDETYSWKIIDKKEYEEENIANQKFREKLLELVKTSKSKYFKKFDSKQCVATSINSSDIKRNQDYDSIVKDLKSMIDDFISIFKNKI